ncbi:glycosyl hydrolase family 28-related protein [Paenibacillus hodogayensis]|uniref:Glycosyl hydrolase family 28-related protein n=1 Tax=Paenibacillus hodogayensis TaxID=279208 RepID=A0ABV5W3U6_9BACL
METNNRTDVTLVMEEQGEQAMSRRKLLKSLGIAGAALAAGSLITQRTDAAAFESVTGSVYGLAEDGCCSPDEFVINTTIAVLRAATAANPDHVHFVRDLAQEGHFRYDSSDTTTADNTGTVLVSASGLRFKRLYSGALNAKWFGAKGDGVSDDTAALQKAVDIAQDRGDTLYLPTADYMISAPIVIGASKRSIRIVGDGYHKGSWIRAHSSITPAAPLKAAFLFDDSKVAERFEFSDIVIQGETGKFEYGIYTKKISHSLFRRIRVVQTKVAAIGIGYGWCNDIETCELSFNFGDGIFFTADNVNMLNVVNTKLFSNDGFAANLANSSLTVRFNGCSIEKNKVGGIYTKMLNTPLDISDCYFEDNGSVGYQLQNPNRLIRSCIIINGNTAPNIIANAYPTGAVRITNNIVSVSSDESFVACYSAGSSLEIGNNTFVRYKTPAVTYSLLRTGTSKTGLGAKVNNLRIYGNGVWENHKTAMTLKTLWIEDLGQATTLLHSAWLQGVPEPNYAPAPSTFTSVFSGGGGAIAPSATKFNGNDVYELSGAANTDVFGFSINLADYPRLAGKYVYIAFYARASAASTGAVAYTSQLSMNTTAYTPDTNWRLISYVDLMPASGTVSFGLRKISASAGSILYVSLPVLKEVGAATNSFIEG